MKRLIVVGAFGGGLILAACGGSSGSGPTSPTPTHQPTSVSLTGTVSASSGGSIIGATVRITDGTNAGQSTTGNGGSYRFDGPTPSNANVFASGSPCFGETGKGVYIDGTSTLNFLLDRGAPWSANGTGDNAFDMPRCGQMRVHITGDYSGRSSNFIVHIDGNHIVNELLGTTWRSTHFEGTYATEGGLVEIMLSGGVKWSMTEVR